MAASNWVSDQLINLIGLSESAVVSFVVSVAKRATDGARLAQQLEGAGLPPTQATRTFANELLQRFSTQAPVAPSAYRQQEDKAVALAAKNRKYVMLDFSDEEPDTAEPPPAPSTTKLPSRAELKAERHLRKKQSEAENVEEQPAVSVSRKKRAWEEEPEDEAADAERKAEVERQQDQREKEEFEARLQARDDEKTRRLVEQRIPKEELEDAARRKYETEEEKQGLLPKLRDYSRQQYLSKREDVKLQEMEDAIRDEEMMFSDVKLSKKEQAELTYKKEVLRLAKEKRAHLDAIEDRDVYRMPESYDAEGTNHNDKRYEVLTARYKEVDEDEEEGVAPWKEQENWESHQIASASLRTGAKDIKSKQKSYDYVFEDSIAFVMDQVLAGEQVGESDSEDEKEKRAREKRTKFEALQHSRTLLPMYEYREPLLKAIAEYQTLVIVGETGSGKTTQIPQYLHEEGYSKAGRIGCTQPRRVAAMSVAARVAEEVGCKLGQEVGYSIRFEDSTSDKTVIKYMTDGMLLREFLGEPDLASYSVMMIDEAHERTLHTDILFGLIKDIARFRPDIKLLISSATLDAEKFSQYFDDAPIFRIPGRRYPVDIFYTKQPEADYVNAAVLSALQVHLTQPRGDVLVFLTGQEEIEACEELLKQRTRGMGSKVMEMIIAPIYANLPSDLQAKIFEPTPPNARKVVLATNIAETSLTIDGIRYVIDPGFCKQNSYNPRSGMFSLQVTPVSRAAALQRTGRAGRTAPGKSFRLYTVWSFHNELEENTVPEIQRTNLGTVVLMLKSLGINDLMNFDFMDPPPAESLLRALEQLYALGALNDRGELTKLGRRMAEFPLDPMMAKSILAAEKYEVTEEMATICAMLSIGNAVFYRPKDKAVHADNAHKNFHRGNVGDHIALMNVYNAWQETNFSSQFCYENFVQVRSMKRARDVRDQLTGLMERVEIDMVSHPEDHEGIKKTITAGFFFNAAKLQRSGNYSTIKNKQTVHMHPQNGLAEVMPRCVVYNELVMTSKEFIRTVSEIKNEWLIEVAPHYYSKQDLSELTAAARKMPKGTGMSTIKES